MDRKNLEEVCLDDENDESDGQNVGKSDQRGGRAVDRVTQRKKDFTSSVFRIIDRKPAESQLESNTSKFEGNFRKTLDIETDGNDATPIDSANKASRRFDEALMTSSSTGEGEKNVNKTVTIESSELDVTSSVSAQRKSTVEVNTTQKVEEPQQQQLQRRTLRPRHKMLMTMSTGSERSFSTDSDPDIADMMGLSDTRSRSLVESLLFDIYDRWSLTRRRDSFDSDALTGYSSTSDALGGRSDVTHGLGRSLYEARLNRANLESKGLYKK